MTATHPFIRWTSQIKAGHVETCNRNRRLPHVTDAAMRSFGLVAAVVAACGNDRIPLPDSPPFGTPSVAVTAPSGNIAFYVTETVAIEWLATDDGTALACDVHAVTGTGSIAIAEDLAVVPGEPVTTAWQLAGVEPAPSVRVEVTCRDDSSPPLVGLGTSDPFAVAAAPQQVSYAAQIQPLLAGCTSMQCHDSVVPQQHLDLTAAKAYVETVGVASEQCDAVLLVKPGAPNESYLVAKLLGSGACFTGTKMPKTGNGFAAPEIQLVRDWIAIGAPNN
jgi:hypothetical protein